MKKWIILIKWLLGILLVFLVLISFPMRDKWDMAQMSGNFRLIALVVSAILIVIREYLDYHKKN